MVCDCYFLAPLKGIPSRVPTSGFRSSVINVGMSNRQTISRVTAGRKEGGVKLLDITEQPLGYAAAKKRKKMQEIEDAKKTTENAGMQSPPSATTGTPDYAAGLSSTPTYAPPTPQPVVTTGMLFYLFIFLLKLISIFFSFCNPINPKPDNYYFTTYTIYSYNNCNIYNTC